MTSTDDIIRNLMWHCAVLCWVMVIYNNMTSNSSCLNFDGILSCLFLISMEFRYMMYLRHHWSANGLVPGGTKPLSGPMLTSHQNSRKMQCIHAIPHVQFTYFTTWTNYLHVVLEMDTYPLLHGEISLFTDVCQHHLSICITLQWSTWIVDGAQNIPLAERWTMCHSRILK